MNFVKKLMKFLLTLVLLAGVGLACWYFYRDQVMEEIDSIQKSIEEDGRKAVLAEQNKEFLNILKTAQNYISEAELLECNIYMIYPHDDPFLESTAARDKTAPAYRQITRFWNGSQTDIIGQTLMLKSGRILQDVWTKYETEGEDPCTCEIYQYDDDNGEQYIPAQWDQWYYHWDNLSPDYLMRRFGTLPLNLVNQMEVVDYTEVGTEECAGEQAVHYIVSHRPIFNWVDDLDQQYNIWDEATQTTTFYQPKEYFETVIQQEVKDGYPELYRAFMELVDKRFYQDNQTHMWITEDGRLLKMEIDYTLDSYEYAIIRNYEDFWMTQEVYDEETDRLVTVATDFAQLAPVTRMICFSYGDSVEPIVVPSEYTDLTPS